MRTVGADPSDSQSKSILDGLRSIFPQVFFVRFIFTFQRDCATNLIFLDWIRVSFGFFTTWYYQKSELWYHIYLEDDNDKWLHKSILTIRWSFITSTVRSTTGPIQISVWSRAYYSWQIHAIENCMLKMYQFYLRCTKVWVSHSGQITKANVF